MTQSLFDRGGVGSLDVLGRAIAAYQAGNLSEAEALCQMVLTRNKRHFDALHIMGVIRATRGEFVDALRLLDKAVSVNRRSDEAHYNRGKILNSLNRDDEALASYERALSINPLHVLALLNVACTLLKLNRSWETIPYFDRILGIQPNFPLALHNYAIALNDLGRHTEAIAICDRALRIAPDYAEVIHNRGIALARLGQYERAMVEFEKAATIRPDLPYVRGDLVHAKLHCCHWESNKAHISAVVEGVRAGKPSDWPHSFIAISETPGDQLLCSRIFVADKCPPIVAPVWKGKTYQHQKIRIAYLSADFHEHPVAYLSAGLFESHDAARFNTIAISLGSDRPSAMRSRLKAAFDDFIDVGDKSDVEVARLIRAGEFDIVVDLMGFTLHNRLGILAHRPAPIQVNYLGFPGTIDAPYMDYIIADRIIAPFDQQANFGERIVHLPDSYQVNDRKRPIAERMPTRSESGLPDENFVFCCFNNSFKIAPSIFDVWMRLLANIDHSVLWLLKSNEEVVLNLRREAAARGVDPARLVFAPRMGLSEHLARHRLADLFLDTLPYNAHTTGSDALWAGVPMVSCKGQAFAGRVGASLLYAAGLPELVAESLEDYEVLAEQLANDSARLQALRRRLQENRLSCALFDTKRTCRQIESAYTTMWEVYQSGERPRSFSVEDI